MAGARAEAGRAVRRLLLQLWLPPGSGSVLKFEQLYLQQAYVD